MFKDTFKLKKSSWHVKLMKYTLNLNYCDFDHLCPYFWLTIFNIIIFPVFGPIKFLIKIVLGTWFKALFEYITDKLESYKENKRQKLIEKYKLLFQIKNEVIEYNYDAMNRNKYIRKAFYSLTSEEQDQVENEVFTIRKQREKEKTFILKSVLKKETDEEVEKRKLLEKQRKIAIKQKITKIVIVVKPLIRLFIYAIAAITIAIALYYFYKLIIILTEIKPRYYIDIGKIILVWLLSGLSLYLLINGLNFIVSKIIATKNNKLYKRKVLLESSKKKFRKQSKIVKNIKSILKYIFLPFTLIFKIIIKFFIKMYRSLKKFIQITKQIYKKECPAINWED